MKNLLLITLFTTLSTLFSFGAKKAKAVDNALKHKPAQGDHEIAKGDRGAERDELAHLSPVGPEVIQGEMKNRHAT